MTGLGIFWRISRIGEGNVMTWRLVVEYWSYIILHDSSVCKLTICMWNINAEHNPWCFSNWRLPKSERHSVKNTHRVGRLRCFKEAQPSSTIDVLTISSWVPGRSCLSLSPPGFPATLQEMTTLSSSYRDQFRVACNRDWGFVVFGGSTFEGAPHWKTRNLFLMEMHFEMIGNISKL